MIRLVASAVAIVAFASAASAATLSDVSGSVLVDSGKGFKKVSAASDVPVGSRVMEIVANPAFLAEVARKGAFFAQKLEALVAAHPDIFESVRGQGLMLGLKSKVAPTDLVKAGYDQHILTVAAADNTLRLLPPLTITDAEITEAVNRLDKAAGSLHG